MCDENRSLVFVIIDVQPALEVVHHISQAIAQGHLRLPTQQRLCLQPLPRLLLGQYSIESHTGRKKGVIAMEECTRGGISVSAADLRLLQGSMYLALGAPIGHQVAP